MDERRLTLDILDSVNTILRKYLHRPNTEEVRNQIKMDVWAMISKQYIKDAQKYKVSVSGVDNFNDKDGHRWYRSFHEVNVNITHHGAPVWFKTKDRPDTLMHVIVTARGLAKTKDHEEHNRFLNAMKGV